MFLCSLRCYTFTTETPGTANEEDDLTATGEEDFYEDALIQGSTSTALNQNLTYDGSVFSSFACTSPWTWNSGLQCFYVKYHVLQENYDDMSKTILQMF